MVKVSKKKILYILELSVLIGIAAVVHFYRIGNLPDGINVDEMGMGYDAWSLAHFGVDRYLKSYPVYLTNFGGGQSPLYVYLCMPLIKFFGLSATVMRLPGIVLFLVAMGLNTGTFLLSEEDGEGKSKLCAFLTAILPVFVLLFRIGMDCNLMLATTMIFFYFMVRAVRKDTVSGYLCAGVAGGILLYTYAISYVILPVFLLFLLLYLVWVKKVNLKKAAALMVPVVLLAMPLILVQIVNMFDLPEFKIGIFTATKLPLYRAGEIRPGNFNLDSVRASLMSIFMFDNLRYNTIPQFGTVYYISLPFIMIGIGRSIYYSWASLKNRSFRTEMIYLIWLLLLIVCGCFMAASTNRLNAAFAAILFMLVEGIYQAAAWLGHIICRKVVMRIIICAYLCSFAAFSWYYFGGQYIRDYGMLDFFNAPLDGAIAYIEQDALCSSKKTYIKDIDQPYIYYLGAGPVSPYEYSGERVFDSEDPDAFENWTNHCGRYSFREPERLEWNANYIIEDSNAEYGSYLDALGFQKHSIPYYNIYTFQLDAFRQLEDGLALEWTAGVNKQNQIMLQQSGMMVNGAETIPLSGWSFNKEMQCPWDSVYISVDGTDFYADTVKMKDVAQVFENEELVDSGMVFAIPKEALVQGREISLNCIDAKNRVYVQMGLEVVE